MESENTSLKAVDLSILNCCDENATVVIYEDF